MKTNLPITNNELTFGADERIISTTDRKGIITSINDVFVRISGFSREELVGKSHNIVRHPEMPPLTFENLWKTLKGGKPWIGMVKNRCKNGDYYWVHAYVSPLFEGEEMVGYQSVRYQPSRAQVARAEKLYSRINKNGGKLGLLGTLVFHRNYQTLNLLVNLSLFLAFAGVGLALGWLTPLQAGIVAAIGLPVAFVLSYLMSRPLSRLRASGKAIADNDLLEFLYSGNGQEAASVEHAMLMLQSKLNTAVGRLHHFATFLYSAAERSTTAAQSSSENANQMESEIEQVATAVNEMNSTIEEIARNANSTAEKTLSTRAQVDDGNKTLSAAAATITDLDKHVEKTSEVINNLNKDFRKVDTVLRFIEEISEQTNLLALNAAIEAARAGEHGRGFAVVADQVRLLANQTKESTSNIKSLLSALDGDMRVVMQDMGKGKDQMQHVLSQIGHLREDLDLIQESIVTVTDMNTGIATAVHEQHMVVKEINQNIHNINEISNQNAQDSRESTEAAVELGDNAKALGVLIKQVTS